MIYCDTIDVPLSYRVDSMIGMGLLERHSTGFSRIWLVNAKGSRKVTVCPPKPISNSVSLRDPFWVLYFLRSIPLHWAAWSLDTLSLTTSMLMTASCMFPLQQGTLQHHWMVYSHVWPLSSYGCLSLNRKWTQIKLNSYLLGTNDSGKNTSLCFRLSSSVSKLYLLNLLVISV